MSLAAPSRAVCDSSCMAGLVGVFEALADTLAAAKLLDPENAADMLANSLETLDELADNEDTRALKRWFRREAALVVAKRIDERPPPAVRSS